MAGVARRGAGLSRDEIVAKAITVADAEGFERLSMRRLGDALGVEAMSLYHHMPNKIALLDAMVDCVFEEITLPAGTDWQAGMRTRARSQREALRRHPWALRLLESRSAPGPANLRHHDAVLGFLRGAGFSIRAAGHAYALLDAFVYGFAVQEQALPFDAETASELASSMLGGAAGAGFPHLAEFMRAVILPGGYDFADEFDVGLDLVLDALESLRKRP
ncbi:TetR/AcrR family transcriptional regulator [Sinomonas sp. ASV322]|uniref:TetR/AcrR family transcriptional regulator n=1 Tax=Sinomonas sp. ASV322 TaxID=3041920 RepID=UPI0027DE8D0F|nr:TetR/AcrR family transcriptional regulator [Sinomonas sp. ASV322]MDQ4501564.1 TetR/AcrR family transcriptional regulator [Sinomonas sp. ASV322]